MSELTCLSADDLHAYAVGLLDDSQSESIAAHLDCCDACQACLATLDDSGDTLVAQLRRHGVAHVATVESQCNVALERVRHMVDDSAEPSRRLTSTGPSLVGSVLGEYQVFEEIGRGGMGRVYKALQTKLDRVVAIKVLHSNRLHDNRAIARFEREMRAIGRLDHPNIVRAYDAREIDGNPVLVMEFVEGLDLARVLGSLGRVRTADACELVRQAAVGLQYAHENGLVHRDVKPSNLIVTPQGEVKLLDLGLARLECVVATDDEMTGAGQPMGTAAYIAPEQLTDARVADIRSDVYSLGCTLYKLLAGQTPFAESVDDPSCDKSTAQVERAVPPIQQPETDVPSGLSQLMNAMLAKSPDDRPVTPSAVASAIEPYCRGHDLAALQSKATEAEWRRNRDAFKVALPLFSEKPPIRPENSARWAYSSSGKSWSLAVGLLILVSATAYAMSVVITIERNKTKTSLEVPEGSRVAVNGQGDVNVTLPDGNEQVSSPSAVDTRSRNSTSQGLSGPSDEHAAETPQADNPLMDKFVAAVLRHKHVNGDEYRLETEQWDAVCDAAGFSGRLYSRLMTPKVKNWIEDAVKYAMRMVRELDSNGDQVITADEWSRVRHDHLLADTNEDGAVTRQELAVYLLDRERPSDFHEWLPEPGTTSDSSVHGNDSALRDSGSERDVVIRLDVGGNITFTVSGDAPTHLGKDFQQLVALIEKHSQQAAIRMEVESASGLPDGTLDKLMRACGVVGTALVTVHVPDKVRPVVFVKNRQQYARGSRLTQTRQPVIMVRSRDNGGPLGYWPVDAEGNLLPPDEFAASQTRDYLRVDAGLGVPTGSDDSMLASPTVAGAAKIAAALGTKWKSMGLEWLVVVPDEVVSVPDGNGPKYVLLAKGGDPAIIAQWLKSNAIGGSPAVPITPPPVTVVLWGHMPGRESEGEPTTALKVETLDAFVKYHGPLDRLAGATVIELVRGGTVSADLAAGAPARLDFRIAAVRESKEAAGLSQEEIGKLIEQLVLADMVTPTDNTNSKYLWLECHKQVWDDITHRNDQWVSSMHAEKLYLLVSNEPDGTMLSSDQGDRAWKIASAQPTKDSQDHLAISIELDKSGGRLLGELTQQHLNRPLAMIIDNKVVMVPTIRSKITNKVQISGRFAPDDLDGLLKSLNVDEPTKGVK